MEDATPDRIGRLLDGEGGVEDGNWALYGWFRMGKACAAGENGVSIYV